MQQSLYNKKIDICQLTLIKFYKRKIIKVRGITHLVGIEFIMKFSAESGRKKTILFVMQFDNYNNYHETYGVYDYTNRFIKVLWGWVAAKKQNHHEKIV